MHPTLRFPLWTSSSAALLQDTLWLSCLDARLVSEHSLASATTLGPCPWEAFSLVAGCPVLCAALQQG